MRPIVGPEDHVVRLPDGRLLGYAEYGDPQGRPIINCHGGLTCRLDVHPADAAARSAGVRLLSPDRPGIGLSSRLRNRTIGAWAGDVAALADQLGIDRFAVMGWSFGGPFAAACAALLPERVATTAIIAGGVPLDWPCAAKGFENTTDAVFFRLCQISPLLASVGLRTVGEVAAHTPTLWMRLGSSGMATRDVEAIERDGIREFALSIGEGLRCPAGVVDDYLSYSRPWGFEYERIKGPVHLWQGDEDTFLPVAWSEEAARRIPHAKLSIVPGYGHFLARDHWAEIFAGLGES